MTTDVAPDLPGLTFVKRLGKGGFAEVFLYEQAHPRMRVAVKVLSAQGLDESARERFAEEANAMAELADHPYIVQVFRSDVTADGRPYIVMKYYPQRNLAVRARAERLTVPEVLQLGVRIASAVETAHRAGILHRDIKPANILTSQYGEPGLTDFGIATTSTTSGEVEGVSVPWSAPEVLFGKSKGDRLSDVYSLGATLWHLLVGRSPFEEPGGDNSSIALMRRIKEQPPPRTGRDDVPPALERVLAQALAKNPDERVASAFELARLLQSIETEQRWAPTPLVVLADPPEDAGAEASEFEDVRARSPHPADRFDATRLKRPREVLPHTVNSPAVPGLALNGEDDLATRRRGVGSVRPTGPALRERVGMPTSKEALETLRPLKYRNAISEPECPPDPPRRQRRVRPRLVLMVGGCAVAVAAIAAAVVAHGGTGHATTTTDESPPITAASEPSGIPVVSSVRLNARQVEYRWTIPDPERGEVFVYKVNNGSYRKARSDHVVLDVPVGHQDCVSVEIVEGGVSGAPGTDC